MRDGIEVSAKTVDEAIEAALEQLGASEDEVEIVILEEGGPRGILGRKIVPARIRVGKRDERTEEDLALEREALEGGFGEGGLGEGGLSESPPPLLQEQADAAVAFLEALLREMGLDGEATAQVGSRAVAVELEGAEMGLLIGRHGLTLEALQELVRSAVQRQIASGTRIDLDIEGYRARQRAQFERRARDAAARVRRTRKPVALEPMSAFGRKIVHDTLAGMNDVSTSSEGEDPNRKVVVRPKGDAPPSGERSRRPPRTSRRGPDARGGSLGTRR